MDSILPLFIIVISAIFAGVLTAKKNNAMATITVFAVYAIVISVLTYLFMPVLTPFAFAAYIGITLFIAGALQMLMSDGEGGVGLVSVLISILLFFLLLLVVFAAPIFGSYQLYSLPRVTESTNLTLISSENIREVSEETAQWRADKVIGEIGYKVEVEHMNIQMINGKLVWIAPLDYNGLWKSYVYGNEGTGGYAVVQAEDSKAEVKLVKDIPMRYTQNAVFGYNLHRLVYADYPGYYLGEHTFQLDADGNPKWVTMVSTPAVNGVVGDIPVGIVVTDPIYGVNEFYPMGRIPDWVQRVMDEQVTEKYLTYWGEYKYGWWNTIFNQKDFLKPTGGLSINDNGGGSVSVSESGDPDVFMVRGTDGKLYWFGSFTTVGKDTSMVGYMLTDLHTGEFKFYRTPGIYNDIGAAKNVQQNPEVSKVMGTRVSQPIMYLIDGEEVWIMPVITESGENVMMGVVRAKTGETYVAPKLNEALAELRGQTTIDKNLGTLLKQISATSSTDCEKIIDEIAMRLSDLKQCIHTSQTGTCSV